MGLTNRAALGWLGAILLVVVGTGAVVAVFNWDAVSRNLDAQSEKTQATLFRWGEVMSIGAELKARYGANPDVTYDTASGDRVLGITFSSYPLPAEATPEDHAREIAVFAVTKTRKFNEIDEVRVLFEGTSETGAVESTGGLGLYRFALEQLMPGQPERESAKLKAAPTQ
jgi:hypothetical protein